MTGSSALDAMETVLASHRGFGDSDYIRGQMCDVFTRRLEKIADTMPDARTLLEALSISDKDTVRSVMSDMVLRCAIQHALWGVEIDWQRGLTLDQCAELFRETTSLLEQGFTEAPSRFGVERPELLGLPAHRGWIWTNEHADDPFFRAFGELIDQNYRGYLCTPGAEELAGLRRGAQLLHDLVPQLCNSALSHATVIGVFPQVGQWKGSGSSSQFRLTGTVFLDGASLDDPGWVAEHLLHESLHQKLYDFRHGHTLFAPRSPELEVHAICSPWNSYAGRANQWDAFRGFAAFHVYVHLALLGARIEQSALGESDPPRAISSRKAIDRARYLGYSLEANCWDELGAGGKRFHSWLTSVLDVLDPAPAREGAYVHLLLDLYRREANTVQSADGVDAAELSDLLADEVDTTRSLLCGLGAPETQVDRFDSAVSEYLESGTADVQDRFFRVRAEVAQTISGLARDGVGIDAAPGLADPNDKVWEMVKRSSERISALLAPATG